MNINCMTNQSLLFFSSFEAFLHKNFRGYRWFLVTRGEGGVVQKVWTESGAVTLR